MRKEVGLSNFNSIANNEALGFFINDISSNPSAKTNAIKAKFQIKMIRFELAVIDRTQFIWIKWLYYKFVKPIVSGFLIVCKHIIVIPFGRAMIKLFPEFVNKISQHNANK